jgi:hypothetical protein
VRASTPKSFRADFDNKRFEPEVRASDTMLQRLSKLGVPTGFADATDGRGTDGSF